MFSSRKAVTAIDDVPAEWIFEHYLKLGDKLTGQNLKMKSIFNPSERTPSMFIYLCPRAKRYKFKCFSTGLQGDGIKLIMHLYNLDFASAFKMIQEAYLGYLSGNNYEVRQIVPEPKWVIDTLKLRSWNKDDVSYWSPYNIGSKALDYYNVRPIAEFTMTRDVESFTRTGRNIYGYFKKNGDLYKIYMPKNKDRKFISLQSYFQGWDQIQNKERLFICSSLKDIMAMRSLGIDGDYVAPSSENSGIEPIIEWIYGYPQKYVIFDNDTAGLKVMQKYQTEYGLPYIHLDMSKDISDSVKEHGAKAVKQHLISLLEL
jgi:hypothetical protein